MVMCCHHWTSQGMTGWTSAAAELAGKKEEDIRPNKRHKSSEDEK